MTSQMILRRDSVMSAYLMVSVGCYNLDEPYKKSTIQSFMYKLNITIVPKEVGQLWDEILENMLHDIDNSKTIIPNEPLTELIPHVYNPLYNIYQAQSYQQHSSNLCGYHASFNTLCFLNLVKRGVTKYSMQSGASFWRFKKSVEKFLFQIKKTNKLKEEWPWRQGDILHGDFERSYNKLCLDYFQDFQIFRSHEQFQLYSYTWQFQFKNLLLSQDKKKELNGYMNYFKSYQKEKPLIISFMLAITNHWMSLVAIKIGTQTQYWFFDSLNRHILDLNDQQISQLVQKMDKERIQNKGSGFSPFFKDSIGVRMKDTQISLKLIVDCLQGKTTIDEYVYNQQFNIFANQIEKNWNEDLEQTHKTIKDYWQNIHTFFKFPVQHHLFNEQNKRRFIKLVDISLQIRLQSEETKKLYLLVRKYSNKTCV